MRVVTTLAAGFALLSAGACATASQGGNAPGDEPVSVEISNRNWSDIHAYVYGAGQRLSLGLVTTHSTRTFRIPEVAFGGGGGLVFIALPIGSRLGYVSEEVVVRPGDRVVLLINNRLQQSSISIRY